MDEFLDKYIFPYTEKYIGRAKRNKDGLPIYSPQEETANAITHAIGVLIGVGMVAFSLLHHHSGMGMIGGMIYGVTLVILYLASSAYHGTSPENTPLKKLFRVFDHCSIFILAAGTCTPFVLKAISCFADESEWIFYAVIWALALGGIALLCVSLEKYSSVATVMYVGIGILLVSRSDTFMKMIGETGIELFLAGGAVYLIGLLFYGLGTKRAWMHTVFHVFCLIGSVIHCVCVGMFVI